MRAGAFAAPVAAALLALASCASWVPAEGAVPLPRFDVQAHRGGRGLSPENTLAAFRKALSIGVHTLETDLAVTRDDVLVLAHDPYVREELARTPDGRWLGARGPAIRTLSLAELRRYDIGRLQPGSRYAEQWPEQQAADGERYPTLDALFALLAQHRRAGGAPVRLNLETKITPDSGDETPPPARFARLLVDAVRRAGMAGSVTIQSFDWRTLREVHRIAPEIVTACLSIESATMDTVRPEADGASRWQAGLRGDRDGTLVQRVRAAGCSIWSMFWRNLAVSSAQEAKALGLRLLPWTVNDPVEMHRLIDLGVDGLITDYPDRLRRVLAERRMPLPPDS